MFHFQCMSQTWLQDFFRGVCRAVLCPCTLALYNVSVSVCTQAWMIPCGSESSGNWRRWGQQWDYVSGKWLSISHECRFDQLPLSNEQETLLYTSLPLPNDKHLFLFHTPPCSLVPPPPPPPHPPVSSSPPLPPIIPLCPSFSMDDCWYSRGIVEEESFPGTVASSSQIKQGTCPDHLTLGSVMKPSDRNVLLQACPPCTHICLFVHCLSPGIVPVFNTAI